ncbi:MAG: hypothetical protein NC342_04140 [Pseudoflavonifractor sp.]|nr:hypothetical protein [Alloprevotella sp.]MCM1116706.1 hypothetical protein [Pseudoflavonifractor sp.]
MDENKNKATAMVATVVFHAALLAILLWVTLSYAKPATRVWPPEDTSELLLADDYVEVLPERPKLQPTENPAQAEESQPAPAPDANDPVNAGEEAPETPPTLTSTVKSPAKAKPEPVPEKAGPSKAELEAQAKAKREAESQQRINNRVNFNRPGKGTSEGKSDGNDNSTARSNRPGFNLKGRSIEKWDSPRATKTGSIIIEVRVDREGKVVGASYKSGSGAVAADESARRSCIAAASTSRFSVDLNARAEQTGTITYRFE